MAVNPLEGVPLKGTPSKNPTFAPSGKLWPYGGFSFGYARYPGDERLDTRPLADSWHEPPQGSTTVPLNLVNASNSHKTPRPRGLLGITTYGRRSLKSAVWLLENNFKHLPLTFATLTLPPLDRPARQALSGSWSEVLRQLIQWVNRELKGNGLPPLVVSCSEIQPERFEKTGEAYLHLHLVWPNRAKKSGSWGVDVKRLRAFWHSLIERQAGITLRQPPNVKILPCTKSPGKELGKYLSKGGKALQAVIQDLGPENCPSTWWNLSGEMRSLVKDALIAGGAVGALIESWLAWAQDEDSSDLFTWTRPIKVEIDGLERVIGHTGELTPAANQDAHGMLISR